MEIGSIYSLGTLDTMPHPPMQMAGEGAAYFSLCREALLSIAIKYRNSAKRVLLPAYTCQTVIDPFLQEGWAICYYGISRQLRIDTDDLSEKFKVFKPNLCVAHPYYGADLNQKELDALSELKDNGCCLVEDLTQCVFSTQRSEIFDYFTGSYRKWFPIPDGAFLVGKENIGESHLEENADFVKTMADAMYLRGVFQRSGDVNVKEISRRVGNMAISHISKGINLHGMSSFSKSLLQQSDLEASMKQRFENYHFLYKNLAKAHNVKVVDRKMEEITCAPLFFPIYVKERTAFQKHLAQNEIYAPVLWPVHTKELLINDTIKQMFDEILMLPIDQRYGMEDMKRMIDVILRIQ